MLKTKTKCVMYVSIVIFFTLIIFLVSSDQIPFQKTISTVDTQAIYNVTIKITSETWSLQHTYKKTTNITVYALLNQTAQKYHFNLNKTYFSGYESFYIESINNMENGKENKYWQYIVNNQYANQGCSSYCLSNDDTVEWIYAKNPYIKK